MTAILPDSAEWKRFEAAVPNRATRTNYTLCLRHFFAHSGVSNVEFCEAGRRDVEAAEGLVQDYIGHLKARAERKEIALGSVRARVKPVKLYCVMNRIRLDWDFISRQLPKGKRFADDRAPTREEIKKVLNQCTLRMKVAVEMMASGGFRVGSWDYLTVRDGEPVERGGKAVAAKVVVYRGEPEQYFTYITPEAYSLLTEYVDFRRTHGEAVAPDAPLIRDEFAVSQGRKGTASVVKRLGAREIERELVRILNKSGLRNEKKRRYDFKVAHGYRKWFKTQAEQVMKPINVEVLMGHSIGISDSYYRPREGELLEDYLKAVPLLSISEAVDVRGIKEELRAEFEERLARLEEGMGERFRRQASS